MSQAEMSQAEMSQALSSSWDFEVPFRGSAGALARPSSPVRTLVVEAEAECVGMNVSLRVSASDLDVQEEAAQHGGRLPRSFELTRQCVICGERHRFSIRLKPDEVRALREGLKEGQKPDNEPLTAPPFEVRSLDPVRLEARAEPVLQDLSDTPLARANELWCQGNDEDVDDDTAIGALEEAIELYASVGRESAVPQCRVVLAERLADRDPRRARQLAEQALPVLTGPVMRGMRQRASALLERLGS